MIIVLLIILITIPIQLCSNSTTGIVGVRLVFDVICMFDIVITFNTGYQNMNTKKIVMNRSKVAM